LTKLGTDSSDGSIPGIHTAIGHHPLALIIFGGRWYLGVMIVDPTLAFAGRSHMGASPWSRLVLVRDMPPDGSLVWTLGIPRVAGFDVGF